MFPRTDKVIQLVKIPYKHPSEKPRNSYLIKTTAHSKIQKQKIHKNSLQVLPVASQTRPVLQFALFAPEQSPPVSSSVWKQKTHVQQGFSSTLADLMRHVEPTHAHPHTCTHEHIHIYPRGHARTLNTN